MFHRPRCNHDGRLVGEVSYCGHYDKVPRGGGEDGLGPHTQHFGVVVDVVQDITNVRVVVEQLHFVGICQPVCEKSCGAADNPHCLDGIPVVPFHDTARDVNAIVLLHETPFDGGILA
ncbi:hypothetical protein AaE_003756 [Aphanomyces astaci]|uniref:Uncharacterized protein n=1 Tax=Aphanomyces astaci TaxID=112090 RepID=A0A6A5AQZ1_APHAT|nr:hypothetical protein AaE_003756 [Aphanomyces astaci]